jgi:hypothetical protein
MSIDTSPDTSTDDGLRTGEPAEEHAGTEAPQWIGLSDPIDPQSESESEPDPESEPEPRSEESGLGPEPGRTVWELTAAEPEILKPKVPEPRRQRIHFEHYERHERPEQREQPGRPEHRGQLRLELPDPEPAHPKLPQTRSPDSEVMPSSSQDLRVGHRRLLPKWTGWVLLALGVLTLPWVAGLAVELPSRSEAAHYDVSWAGFDVLLCLLLLRTGWSALHDLEHVEVTAAMTGSLLIVDAWFDVMSAPDTRQFLVALAMAGCVELPLAAFCLWIAGRVEFERRRRSEVLTALVRRFETRRKNRPQRSAFANRDRSKGV